MSLFQFFTDPLAYVYLCCVLFGGTVLLLQLFLTFVGFGGDSLDGSGPDDIGHSETVSIFKAISFRTVTAGLAFFGLGGLAGLTGNFGRPISVLFAVASGLVAFFAVYYLYRSIARMVSDGTVTEASLAGANGTVYLRIPAANAGRGKVQVVQQDRTMEYEAVTLGGELANGTPITVVRVVGPNIVEVR